MVALSGWSAALRLARRDLAFERSRAPHPRLALQRWWQALAARRRRAARLAPAQAALLQQAEAACALAGLAYPKEDAGQLAPWHLPARFATLPVQALPPHPLIEPAWLARHAGDRPACEALLALLQPGALPGRWQGLPVGTVALTPARPPRRVAVCLHLFYPEVWPQLQAALAALPEPFDLYITLPDYATTPALAPIVADHPRTRLLPRPNHGRDVLPWLWALRAGVFDGYAAVLKLHSKRSPHHHDGAAWRDSLLRGLLPGPAALRSLLAQFEADPQLGLVGPAAHCMWPGQPQHAGSNGRSIRRVAERAGLPADSARSRPFFAGTMFWFRPQAMQGLRAARLSADDFEPEMAQTDGTTAHALERLVWPLAEQAGYRVACLGEDGSLAAAPPSPK